MTKHFNKQHRDDSQSSFRGAPSNRYGNTRSSYQNKGRSSREDVSSNRYGDARSSRPSKVRLSREMVDRGWENGAQRQHADYRPRTTGGQAPRNNWQKGPKAEHTSYNNAPDNRRSYGDRQNNYRRDDQSYGDRQNNYHRDDQSYGDRQNNYRRDDQSYGQRQHSTNSDTGTSRPGMKYGQRRDPHPARERDFLPNRERRGEARHAREERKYVGEKPIRRRAPFKKPTREDQPLHPRYLSRPNMRHMLDPETPEQDTELTGQFEGDYEQFNDRSDAPTQKPQRGPRERFARDRQPRGKEQAENKYEKHVTRLPDGRVIKGSRPAQRKNAQFWSDINEDTEQVMKQVRSTDVSESGLERGENVKRPTRHKRVSPPKSLGPKPSGKGFKWPKQQ